MEFFTFEIRKPEDIRCFTQPELSSGSQKLQTKNNVGAVAFYQTTCLLIAIFDHCLADETKTKMPSFSSFLWGCKNHKIINFGCCHILSNSIFTNCYFWSFFGWWNQKQTCQVSAAFFGGCKNYKIINFGCCHILSNSILLIAIFDPWKTCEVSKISIGSQKLQTKNNVGAVAFNQTTCLLIAIFDHCLADETKTKMPSFCSFLRGRKITK